MTEGARQGADVGRLLRRGSFHPAVARVFVSSFFPPPPPHSRSRPGLCRFLFSGGKNNNAEKNRGKFPRSSVPPVLWTLLAKFPAVAPFVPPLPGEGSHGEQFYYPVFFFYYFGCGCDD